MPFVTVTGLKGKVFVPEQQPASLKKHPCEDCYTCQICSDDRCRVCRRQQECPCKTVSSDEGKDTIE